MKSIYLWWLRWFCVISMEHAENLGLKFGWNVYGDEINRLGCRSVWLDERGNVYRVEELKR